MPNSSPAILKLGTRRSALALTQSGLVAKDLEACHAGLRVELVHVVTTGDQTQNIAFDSVGTVGMFVKEIEQALLDRRVDFAVHSLKDLPTTDTPGLSIIAVPPRVDPHDLLVTRDGRTLEELPPGAKVGTGSPRRQAQILARRPDLEVIPVRGNVDTRLAKLDRGDYDAILLAAAGMTRLGLIAAGRTGHPLRPPVMLPAAGQGCLALQARSDDAGTARWLRALDHPESHAAARAERALLRALGGGCHAPIAGLAQVIDGRIRMSGVVATTDGRTLLSETIEHPGEGTGAPEAAGLQLARRLFERGAGPILGLPAVVES